MSDSFPVRTELPEVISRVQARFNALAPDEAAEDDGSGDVAAVSREIEHGESWVARAGGAPSEVLEQRLQRLDRQLQVLRDQLDQVFDDLEDRLADAEGHAAVAEARASVAEARASVAEARAADAEVRANDAHHRVDDLMGELARVLAADREPGRTGEPDLRSALDRLRDRLDAS